MEPVIYFVLLGIKENVTKSTESASAAPPVVYMYMYTRIYISIHIQNLWASGCELVGRASLGEALLLHRAFLNRSSRAHIRGTPTSRATAAAVAANKPEAALYSTASVGLSIHRSLRRRQRLGLTRRAHRLLATKNSDIFTYCEPHSYHENYIIKTQLVTI